MARCSGVNGALSSFIRQITIKATRQEPTGWVGIQHHRASVRRRDGCSKVHSWQLFLARLLLLGKRARKMCKLNRKNGGRSRDPCMRHLLVFLKLYLKEGYKTVASCCGHGRYPMTVVVQEDC